MNKGNTLTLQIQNQTLQTVFEVIACNKDAVRHHKKKTDEIAGQAPYR